MSKIIEHNEDLQFVDEPTQIQLNNQQPWNILIVDDEQEIHRITQMVLGSISFRDRGINFIHASSGEEAIIKLQENKDIAVILLDVVMETDNAGLVVVNKLRNELKNTETRVILRTGHPGYAPENKIIIDYDINDYKEKTELTSQKLITTVIAALRAYEDIIRIKVLNQTLEQQVEERTRQLRETNLHLENSLTKIHEHLESGRKIQFRLLPDRDKYFGKYYFSRHLLPSLYLSGDFVDYFRIDESHIGFYLADVCGHGAPSAFITVLLKSLIDYYIKEKSEKSTEYLRNPAQFLQQINAEILKEKTDKHLTLFYGVIDESNDELTFSHGGQFPHPILLDNGSPYFLNKRGGMPLGLYNQASYVNHKMNLVDSFIMLIFSDGILEILPYDSLEKKQEFLLSKIQRKDLTHEDVLDLFGLNKHTKLMDDITYLIIRK